MKTLTKLGVMGGLLAALAGCEKKEEHLFAACEIDIHSVNVLYKQGGHLKIDFGEAGELRYTPNRLDLNSYLEGSLKCKGGRTVVFDNEKIYSKTLGGN